MRLWLSFADCASQALVRRVAETTNFDPFVKQALTHVEPSRQIHRNPFYARGTREIKYK